MSSTWATADRWWTVTRATRLLLHAGIVGIVLGLSKLHAVANDYDFTASSRLGWAVVYCGIMVVAAYVVGLPELRPTRLAAWVGAGLVALSGALGVSVAQLLLGVPLLPRFVLLGTSALVVPLGVLLSRFAGDADRHPDLRTRFALVAPTTEQVALADELAATPSAPAELVLALTPDEASTATGGVPLLDRVRGEGASMVVLSREAQADESIVAQVALLHETGTRVRTLALFYEEHLHKVPVGELERMSLMFDIGELHRRRYGRVKRALDVALGTLGLLPLVVAWPLVTLAHLVTGDRGPTLFLQERVGRGGQPFTIFKFRSMTENVAVGGAGEWTAEDDPRITTVGRILRKTHVDELPQVINILRGDLSVVGPRPEQPRYVDELRTKLPFYDLRHIVRPGLTGWAQVCYGYAGDERDSLEKLQYEFHYLRHQSIAFDLRIIGRTLRSVVGGPGEGR